LTAKTEEEGGTSLKKKSNEGNTKKKINSGMGEEDEECEA